MNICLSTRIPTDDVPVSVGHVVVAVDVRQARIRDPVVEVATRKPAPNTLYDPLYKQQQRLWFIMIDRVFKYTYILFRRKPRTLLRGCAPLGVKPPIHPDFR